MLGVRTPAHPGRKDPRLRSLQTGGQCIAGLVILFYPLYSAVLLPSLLTIFIGSWVLVIGVIALVRAFRGAGWGAGILGVLSIIFGLLILANPLVSAALLVLLIAIFAILGGLQRSSWQSGCGCAG